MVSARSSPRSEHYTWTLTWKWARHSPPEQAGDRWVAARYYGKFNPSRDDKWVFGDRETGAYLLKHAWTSIRRHVMVKGRASPDDPDLAGYWEIPAAAGHGPRSTRGTLTLLGRQDRTAARYCGNRLIDPSRLPASPEEWEHWWLGVTRRDIPRAPSAPGNQPRHPAEQRHQTSRALMHASCAIRHRSHGSAGARHFNPQKP